MAMKDSGKPCEEQSPVEGTIKIGATVQIDIDGMDARAIAELIHLVYRFHKKAEEIKDGRKN